ncbi:hypothetical protein L3X38_021421 [Prunus dulcis]|uniref:Uncharacterized protein n=1 Tax=Prunus dulcis TaxID=3755 RepID=A0AAD4VU12_PRUDU|nr:hypothetical protein L3X38_021421 [Prunus dulcis]
MLVEYQDHVALSLLLFGLQGPDTPSNPAMPTLLKTQMSCFIVESGVALATSHLHVNFQTLKFIGGENNDDGDVND